MEFADDSGSQKNKNGIEKPASISCQEKAMVQD